MSSSSRPVSSRYLASETSPSDRSSSRRAFQSDGIASRMLRKTMSRATGSSSMWQPAGRNGKSFCDLPLDVAPAAAEQRAQGVDRSGTRGDGCRRSRARCRAPFRGLAASRGRAAAGTGRALGRSQQQQRVDVRDVDALVEQIDREDDVDSAGVEIAERRRSLVHRAVAPDRDGRYPDRAELLRHEAGVRDRDAEAERLDRRAGHSS